MATYTTRITVTTEFSNRQIIRQPDDFLLNELGEIIQTESGESIVAEYGPLGTYYDRRQPIVSNFGLDVGTGSIIMANETNILFIKIGINGTPYTNRIIPI